MSVGHVSNKVRSVGLEKLSAHPGNPNRMSKAAFRKLVRNIKRSGRYEPLVVRPRRGRAGFYEIINGHHRAEALRELGYEAADVVVWDVDDRETDVLLATLNRLGGSDMVDKRAVLLRRLSRRMNGGELAKLLPVSVGQIERLVRLPVPQAPAGAEGAVFARPMVFFVDGEQQEIIERALSAAAGKAGGDVKAKRRSAALAEMARVYIEKEAGQVEGV